jgi:putative transposase
MRYRFVAAERASYPVRLLCRVVGVAASGFYAWLQRGPSRREQQDCSLAERIAAVFAASRRTYGSPRVHADLRAEGVRVSRKRVARLMREGGLVATIRRRFPRTTDSDHDRPVAPNLLERKLTAEQPDTVWLAGISYIPTDEGWLHLAAINDLATREIVGWSMSDSLEAGAACEALRMAIQRRQPSPGLIHHSDRRATCLWRAAEAPGPPWPALLDEPARQRPRQLADGELLRQPEERARPPHHLPDQGGGAAGAARAFGDLRQPPAPPFRRRLLDAGRG